MIEKRTVDKIYINEKNKDGQPYRTKPTERFPDGKLFKRVVVQFAGDNTRYSNNSFSADDEFLKWKSGDEVEVILEQNGDFWNFAIPDVSEKTNAGLEILKDRVEYLYTILIPYIKKYEAEKFSKQSL